MKWIFLTTALVSGLGWAQNTPPPVYKWVDRNGVTHYADKPNSPSAARGIDVKVKRPLSDTNRPVDSPQPDPSVADQDPTHNWERDAHGNAIPPNRTSACDVARKNLTVLNDPNQIALQTNARGKPVVLEGAAKQTAQKRAQDDINLFCNPQ